MKVFISWSGERSEQVAYLLDNWINCVIQAVDPFVSSNIQKGTPWLSKINSSLADTSIGIVCLTKANKDKPWVLFEAGALAKGQPKNRVLTLLIDLEQIDLVGSPLDMFQHTKPDKDDMYSLVSTINDQLEDSSLKDKVLNQVFRTYWPEFEERFQQILDSTEEGKSESTTEKLSSEEVNNKLFAYMQSIDNRLNRIEHSEESSVSDSSRTLTAKDYNNAHRQVKELHNFGASYDVVMKYLISKYGFNSKIANMVMRDAIKEIDEN